MDEQLFISCYLLMWISIVGVFATPFIKLPGMYATILWFLAWIAALIMSGTTIIWLSINSLWKAMAIH